MMFITIANDDFVVVTRTSAGELLTVTVLQTMTEAVTYICQNSPFFIRREDVIVIDN